VVRVASQTTTTGGINLRYWTRAIRTITSMGFLYGPHPEGVTLMMGIGKIEAGKVEYLVDSVARSREDYYVGRGEAPGVWVGGGCGALGLAGEVDAEGLHRVLAGEDPTSGERLVRRQIPGFDGTLKAPKSVSILWGLSDEATRAKVTKAHDRAVAKALSYLEIEAAQAKRGHAGEREVDVCLT